MKPTIFLATDHAGFEHKNALREYLNEHKQKHYNIVDCGNFVRDPNDDYPNWIIKAAKGVKKNPAKNKAVIFGGSGQGEAIAANKVNDVRAVVCYGADHERSKEIVRLSREHNNANVLSFGARLISKEHVIELTELWLETGFSEEKRHVRRIKQIDAFEYKRFWQRFNRLSNH